MRERLKIFNQVVDGEIHFVLEEPQDCDNYSCVDVDEIKRISKKKAGEKLVLTRIE